MRLAAIILFLSALAYGQSVGCGATTSAGSASGPYDQTTCVPRTGNAPYVSEGFTGPANYQTGATALDGTAAKGCDATFSASGRYYLTTNLTAAGGNGNQCFTLANSATLDLGGFTINGYLENVGTYNGLHIFNGTISCNDADSVHIGCLNLNSLFSATRAVWIHDLTIKNLSCAGTNCRNINLDVNAGADGSTCPASPDVGGGLSHVCVAVFNDTLDLATTTDAGCRSEGAGTDGQTCSRMYSGPIINASSSNNWLMEVFNNHIHLPDDPAVQGPTAFLVAMNVHNNWISGDSNGTAETGRLVGCDANLIPVSDIGCTVTNNYISPSNSRGIRIRSRLGSYHDNFFDAPAATAFHVADQNGTPAGVGGTITNIARSSGVATITCALSSCTSGGQTVATIDSVTADVSFNGIWNITGGAGTTSVTLSQPNGANVSSTPASGSIGNVNAYAGATPTNNPINDEEYSQGIGVVIQHNTVNNPVAGAEFIWLREGTGIASKNNYCSGCGTNVMASWVDESPNGQREGYADTSITVQNEPTVNTTSNLLVSGLYVPVSITSISSDGSGNATVVCAAQCATGTAGSPNTATVVAGRHVLFNGTTGFDGVWLVRNVVDTTHFVASTTVLNSSSGAAGTLNNQFTFFSCNAGNAHGAGSQTVQNVAQGCTHVINSRPGGGRTVSFVPDYQYAGY